MTSLPLTELKETFGETLEENVNLAKYSSALVGGPADVLITVNTANYLAETVTRLWMLNTPFYILGGGSNLLIHDKGVRGVIVLNKARKVAFTEDSSPPSVWAESGANFGVIARQAAQKQLTGLEWAAGIPGTIGGAVFGNAGAHGGDMASNLKLAEVLHRNTGRQRWTLDQLNYTYRSSILKERLGQAVVLSATLTLQKGDADTIKNTMDEYLEFRRRTQPPGASMGSMFKNPPNDFAGRLIDEAGLKGHSLGGAQISELHANFFINHGSATAHDIYNLISLAHKTVLEKFNVDLELEIGLLGEWDQNNE